MKLSRRDYLAGMGGGMAAAQTGIASGAAAAAPPVDFRYAPLQWQTAYCFPDDPYKSLVGDRGELLYGHPGRRNLEYFPLVVDFSLLGMDAGVVVRQELESPRAPIVHTRIEKSDSYLDLICFATRRPEEGRVDNVIVRVSPRASPSKQVRLQFTIKTRSEVVVDRQLIYLGPVKKRPIVVSSEPLRGRDGGWCMLVTTAEQETLARRPWQAFLRFPQEGQEAPVVLKGLADPEGLLAETRAFWGSWAAFGEGVSWQLPKPYSDFLVGSTRNIQQAREVRNGKLTFQVGPTAYRGLWVVDGHFILEAARYLGYHKEADTGLDATWSYQLEDGSFEAGAGNRHWKDAGVALCTLVRQCELAGDWRAIQSFQAHGRKAISFLDSLRARARQEPGPAGKYGVLANGLADGGVRLAAEFTNTLWTLVGLKAVAEARSGGLRQPAARLYAELRAAFDSAARQEMTRHAEGFDYLPMVMKEDPLMSADRWTRPKPQAAQWALSQAIYPGDLFAREDGIVKGHIALMQSCTQEDVPTETGWLPHGGLWTYNAGFVAHVHLWAGVTDWARRTFHGFLNHASPLYCWREEQPLRGSAVCTYVGDMPHNWASAECVLYLRHMLALEDGARLRLLEGIGEAELAMREAFVVKGSPTRFGRIGVALEPQRAGWQVRFERGSGPAPAALELPVRLGRYRLTGVEGAAHTAAGEKARIEPGRGSWRASYGG
jgi:hypothetical protein